MLSVLFLIPGLSGCIAVAAGAAAGGGAGYYMAKEDRPSPQVSEDDNLTAQVRQRFAQDPQLAALRITVDTYDNTVTLTGDVPSGAMAQRAIDTAHSVPGIKGVRSELTVH